MKIMLTNLMSKPYDISFRNSFYGFAKPSSKKDVFSEMPLCPSIAYSPINKTETKDTLVKKTSKISKLKDNLSIEKLKSHKKLILAGGLILAGIIGAVILKKNFLPSLKGKVNNIQNNGSVVLQEADKKGITEELTDKARKFLIRDVQETGSASVNGVCFYGPDCIGKENAIEGFLKDLQEAGYRIERAPRAGEKSINETGAIISKLFKKAEETFSATGERTAVLVRDLDKLAPDRRTSGIYGVTRVLLDTQECRNKGYTWIGEASDLSKIDSAVLRPGRMGHFISIRPLVSESQEVWMKYKNFINTFSNENKRNALLKEAEELLRS